MAVNVRRLRPTRATFAVLIGAVWAMSFGAVREFVWADLRSGLVSTSGLHWLTRALVRVGIVLLLVMVFVLLFNDVLRDAFPLIAGTGATAGRGSLVPSVLLPVTMFMVAVAWTFLLTGALHSHWSIRIAVVLAYLGTTVGWLSRGLFGAGWQLPVAWAALLLVPVFYAIRWRRPLRPALEFPVLLAAVGVVYVITQRLLLDSYLASGVPLFIASIESTILLLGFLVTPLLILIGLDIAEFAYRAGGWGVSLLRERFGGVALGLAFAGLIGWRMWTFGSELVLRVRDGQAVHYVGSLGIPVVVGVVWYAVHRLQRQHSEDATPEGVMDGAVRNAAKLAVGYVGWQVILTIGIFGLLAVYAVGGVGSADTISRGVSLIGSALSGNDTWRLVFSLTVLGIGLFLARRRRGVMALYLSLVGAVDLYHWFTDPGKALDAITWEQRSQVSFWWTVLTILIALFLAARRRLDGQALEGLFLVAVIITVAGGPEAVGDPFSPFFAFAGAGIIAFGIMWDVMTVGSWANEDSGALPRANRMLLYLGYVLFSVTVINWALTTHDLSNIDFYTDGATSLGFATFGAPVLYAIYALTFARIINPPPATDEVAEETEPVLPVGPDAALPQPT